MLKVRLFMGTKILSPFKNLCILNVKSSFVCSSFLVTEFLSQRKKDFKNFCFHSWVSLKTSILSASKSETKQKKENTPWSKKVGMQSVENAIRPCRWMTEKKRKVWLRCLLLAEKKNRKTQPLFLSVLNLQTKSSKRSLSSLPPKPTFHTTKALTIWSPIKSNKITQWMPD